MLYSCNNQVQCNEYGVIKQKVESFIIEDALSIYDSITKQD